MEIGRVTFRRTIRFDHSVKYKRDTFPVPFQKISLLLADWMDGDVNVFLSLTNEITRWIRVLSWEDVIKKVPCCWNTQGFVFTLYLPSDRHVLSTTYNKSSCSQEFLPGLFFNRYFVISLTTTRFSRTLCRTFIWKLYCISFKYLFYYKLGVSVISITFLKASYIVFWRYIGVKIVI